MNNKQDLYNCPHNGGKTVKVICTQDPKHNGQVQRYCNLCKDTFGKSNCPQCGDQSIQILKQEEDVPFVDSLWASSLCNPSFLFYLETQTFLILESKFKVVEHCLILSPIPQQMMFEVIYDDRINQSRPWILSQSPHFFYPDDLNEFEIMEMINKPLNPQQDFFFPLIGIKDFSNFSDQYVYKQNIKNTELFNFLRVVPTLNNEVPCFQFLKFAAHSRVSFTDFIISGGLEDLEGKDGEIQSIASNNIIIFKLELKPVADDDHLSDQEKVDLRYLTDQKKFFTARFAKYQLLTGRMGHQSVYSIQHQKVFILGGTRLVPNSQQNIQKGENSTNSQYLQSCQIIDLSNEKQSQVHEMAPMKFARSRFNASYNKDKIFVFGGFQKDNEESIHSLYKSSQVYDVLTNVWTIVKIKKEIGRPMSFAGSSSIDVGDHLFLFGGGLGESFDQKNNQSERASDQIFIVKKSDNEKRFLEINKIINRENFDEHLMMKIAGGSVSIQEALQDQRSEEEKQLQSRQKFLQKYFITVFGGAQEIFLQNFSLTHYAVNNDVVGIEQKQKEEVDLKPAKQSAYSGEEFVLENKLALTLNEHIIKNYLKVVDQGDERRTCILNDDLTNSCILTFL